MEAPNTHAVGKICEFGQISLYISNMVQVHKYTHTFYTLC